MSVVCPKATTLVLYWMQHRIANHCSKWNKLYVHKHIYMHIIDIMKKKRSWHHDDLLLLYYFLHWVLLKIIVESRICICDLSFSNILRRMSVHRALRIMLKKQAFILHCNSNILLRECLCVISIGLL